MENWVASGVQMSIRTWVMAVASMVVVVVSMPLKSRPEYFLVALPSTVTSAYVAALQLVFQLSTATSV